jgi:hypothetical protein
MSDIERRAAVLLREAASRQAVVDRLLGRSIWNGFVSAMVVPVIANCVFLVLWAGWQGGRLDYSPIFVGGALVSLVWVSLAVVQVAGRLRALATILERSGVLAQFVGANAAGADSDQAV